MSRSYYLGEELVKLNEEIPFDERKKVYYDYRKDAEELQSEWKLRNQIAGTKEKQIKILDKHDWFETNDTCKKCSFLTGAFVAKKELVEEQKWLDDATISINENTKFLGASTFPQEEKMYESYTKEKSGIDTRLENVDVVSENIKLQLELQRNKLGAYHKEKKVYGQNEKALSNNVKIQEKISKLDTTIVG